MKLERGWFVLVRTLRMSATVVLHNRFWMVIVKCTAYLLLEYCEFFSRGLGMYTLIWVFLNTFFDAFGASWALNHDLYFAEIIFS